MEVFELVVLVSAFFMGVLAKQLGLPALTGYLICGLLISLLDLPEHQGLKLLGHVGVLLLLFTVGLHIRLRNILRIEVFGAGGMHILLSMIVFIPFIWYFQKQTSVILFLVVLLAFSSTVLAAKIMEARNELNSYHGRMVIGVLILQDLGAVGLLAVSGAGHLSLWTLTVLLLPLCKPILRKLLGMCGNDDLLLFYGLLLSLGASQLFEWVGLSAELGVLLIGALLAGHEKADEMSKKLWGLKETFLIFFFLHIGLGGFPNFEDYPLVVLLILLLPIKFILFFALFIFFKLRSRTAFMGAITLTSYSEFTIIAGGIAANAGIISSELVVVLALVCVISFIIAAPLNRFANLIYLRYENYFRHFERNVHHPDRRCPSIGRAKYLVLGMGKIGTGAYDHLVGNQYKVVGIDDDPAIVEHHLNLNRRVIYGDSEDPELWEGLKLAGVSSIILALPSVSSKFGAIEILRHRGYKGTIHVMTQYEDTAEMMREAGATTITHQATEIGVRLAEQCMTASQAAIEVSG